MPGRQFGYDSLPHASTWAARLIASNFLESFSRPNVKRYKTQNNSHGFPAEDVRIGVEKNSFL